MNKVLVFTNKDSWGGISRSIRNRVKWNDSYPDGNMSVRYVDYQNGESTLKGVSELSEEGVYLVYDKIDRQLLKQLLDGCEHDSLYVLIHSNGDYNKKEVFDPWQNVCHIEIKEGLHVFSSAKYYTPLFDILTDAEGNKLERSIKRIFMPLKEAALELLNECLVPKRNLDESNAYGILYQKEELRKELDEFRKKYDASSNLKDYEADLERLRDLVLGCQ